ncbi:hypothetical protein C8F01DRAFT_697484 [Mycena amicta]|nr:hypothetical protein C8F01DRAFT_697484 [Mycena amicta]
MSPPMIPLLENSSISNSAASNGARVYSLSGTLIRPCKTAQTNIGYAHQASLAICVAIIPLTLFRNVYVHDGFVAVFGGATFANALITIILLAFMLHAGRSHADGNPRRFSGSLTQFLALRCLLCVWTGFLIVYIIFEARGYNLAGGIPSSKLFAAIHNLIWLLLIALGSAAASIYTRAVRIHGVGRVSAPAGEMHSDGETIPAWHLSYVNEGERSSIRI